ncbi:MAG: T9SS type A sorting domain-containing protein [Gemmatimonadetes bacterium]|nr:T9SS type A sorting domain-containing protein [Gemmatimonadota bacterium]MBT7860193.1 T9SS type A sorting domain-containing protein [Gemmatimonadota bacterium]
MWRSRLVTWTYVLPVQHTSQKESRMHFNVSRWVLLSAFVLSPLVHAQSSGQLDLADLAAYANQPVPSFVTRDNTPANNPLTDGGATLGRVLFYDKKLSVDNTVSCASCHQQEHAFGDTAQISQGVNGTTGRHSMRLINARFSAKERVFWDERAASLEEQATLPIQDHAEMGFSGKDGDPGLDSLLHRMADLGYYQVLFDFVYGDPEITEPRMQLAIAQFIRSIQSFDSRFDEQLAQVGDIEAPFPGFSPEENAGKGFFLGTPVFDDNGLRRSGGFGCSGCHVPPEFSIKLDSGNNGFTVSMLGGRDFGNTRAPALRDLVGPEGRSNGGLMHTGSLSLRRAVDHYEFIQLAAGNTRIDPDLVINGNGWHLEMLQHERAEVVEFLTTLTGSNVYRDEKWSDPFDLDGNLIVIPAATATHVESEGQASALTFELAQNFPNPFNPTTTIAYRVSQASNVSLMIYNVLGQQIATPVRDFHSAGNYRLHFDGTGLTSGMYFYRLFSDGQLVQTRKMLLSR